MRRGAGAEGAAGVAAAGAAVAVGAAATGRAGTAATCAADGGATTAAGRGGGAALAAASACLRSRIAFSASPGLDTFERSNFGFASTAARFVVAAPRFPLKYARTCSAWSASMELEWVFPVTPIASSASRIGLLFTSSSRARSLIRTLLIRPFSVVPAPLAVHISLIEVGIFNCIIPEIAFATQRSLSCVAVLTSHDRFLRYRCPRRRLPGLHRPGCLRRRCPTQSVLPVRRRP
jgi:hypothetical protein